MIKSKKVISIYEPNDIYKVIEELNRDAEELGKLTLEEQTERANLILRGGESGKRDLLLAENL